MTEHRVDDFKTRKSSEEIVGNGLRCKCCQRVISERILILVTKLKDGRVLELTVTNHYSLFVGPILAGHRFPSQELVQSTLVDSRATDTIMELATIVIGTQSP